MKNDENERKINMDEHGYTWMSVSGGGKMHENRRSRNACFENVVDLAEQECSFP